MYCSYNEKSRAMEARKCESLVRMYGNVLGRNKKVTSGADQR